MRGKPRKKPTRKELKQDKFITTTLRVIGFMRRNPRQVVTMALVVLLAVIIGVSVSHSRRETAEKAASLLGKADLEYRSGNYEAAMRLYQSSVQDYGGTESGKLARFYLANCYFLTGRFDQAMEAYRRFLKEWDKDKVLCASALAGIAACYEGKGEYLKAAEQYQECARKYPLTFLAPQFLYDAGRCYEAAGEEAKAETVYRNLVNSYPQSPYARKAELALGGSKWGKWQ